MERARAMVSLRCKYIYIQIGKSSISDALPSIRQKAFNISYYTWIVLGEGGWGKKVTESIWNFEGREGGTERGTSDGEVWKLRQSKDRTQIKVMLQRGKQETIQPENKTKEKQKLVSEETTAWRKRWLVLPEAFHCILSWGGVGGGRDTQTTLCMRSTVSHSKGLLWIGS